MHEVSESDIYLFAGISRTWKLSSRTRLSNTRISGIVSAPHPSFGMILETKEADGNLIADFEKAKLGKITDEEAKQALEEDE